MSRLNWLTFRFSVRWRCACGIVTKWCDFPLYDVTSPISQLHWVMWLCAAWCDLSPALVRMTFGMFCLFACSFDLFQHNFSTFSLNMRHQVRLADQLSVPPMCQRWIIEEPSLQTHEHVANCIAARQGLCCSCYSCCSSFCSIHFSP